MKNDIDTFISGFSNETQIILEELRSTIRKAAPEAMETICYGIPTFTFHGNLVHFSAFKNHIGFYPAPSGILAFKKELSSYKNAKGSVQFPLDKPLPLVLISRIVKFRVKENLEKSNSKSDNINMETNIVHCQWAENLLFHEYHDTEWGVPVHDDKKHFEFLMLEAAQAGLSWATILKRREGYRKAFANFDPKKVAQFTEVDAKKLMNNPAIIRNRLKISAAINNAKMFLLVQKEFGTFDRYIWSFVKGKPITNKPKNISEIPAISNESEMLSKDLKKRGFRFVGLTIIYAHMQAVGMVNDHEASCFRMI